MHSFLDRVAIGDIEDAPSEAFDAATAFLALHFVPDDGRRLEALRQIRARLKPVAPFLLDHGCRDMSSERFEETSSCMPRQLDATAPAAIVDGAVQMVRESVSMIPPEREEALLTKAGFREMRRFYTALWVFGCPISAPP